MPDDWKKIYEPEGEEPEDDEFLEWYRITLEGDIEARLNARIAELIAEGVELDSDEVALLRAAATFEKRSLLEKIANIRAGKESVYSLDAYPQLHKVFDEQIAPDEGLTAYQKKQIGLREWEGLLAQQRWGEEQAWEKQRWGEQAGLAREQFEWQKGQEDIEGRFEDLRQEMMMHYSGARDWTKAWELQNQPNPFTRQPVWSPVEQTFHTSQQQLDYLYGQKKQLLSGGVNWAASQDISKQLSTINKDIKAAEKLRDESGQVMQQDIGGQPPTRTWGGMVPTAQGAVPFMQETAGTVPMTPAAEAPQTATGPPTPSWLAGLYGTEAGAPLTKGPVGPMSLQAYGRLTPSQQQGWMGYADWATGLPAEDILAKMEASRTRTPYGAGGWRTKPTKQRTFV